MTKAQKDLRLWRAWKRNPTPANYHKLKHQFTAVIKTFVTRKFRGAPIPASALEAEAWKQFHTAIQNYNPAAGAQLNTWVINNLMKVNRYVYTHQNIGRIPENRTTKIQTYNSIKDMLEHEYDREATIPELADRLGWTQKSVLKMEKELSPLYIEGSTAEVGNEFIATSRVSNTMKLIQTELSPKENKIFEQITGYGGTRKSIKQIARESGMTVNEVNRVKSKIVKRLRGVLD